jgi:hypothetical protein
MKRKRKGVADSSAGHESGRINAWEKEAFSPVAMNIVRWRESIRYRWDDYRARRLTYINPRSKR